MNSGILWRSPSIDLDDARLSRRRASNAEPHLNLARPLTVPRCRQIRIRLDDYFNNTSAKPFKWSYKG